MEDYPRPLLGVQAQQLSATRRLPESLSALHWRKLTTLKVAA